MPSRDDWTIPEGVTYLHHGAFGPSPRAVLAARAEWSARLESEPMDFLVRRLEDELDWAADVVGRFVGARPANLAFVDNATFAMNVVASTVPLEQGDAVLLTDHEYGAVRRTWRRRCDAVGARIDVATLPYPVTSDEAVVAAILDRVTPHTRLIVLSHVTSPTAIELPVRAVCDAARERGVPVCVDGPHAVGMTPLDIASLGCDFFCASGHKWLCGPFGSGFLYVAPRWHRRVRSPIVSWGGSLAGRPKRWQDELVFLGTRDSAPFLALPAAVRFLEEAGLSAFRTHGHTLAERALAALASLAPGPQVFGDDHGRFGTMAAVRLPLLAGEAPPGSDRDPWQVAIWERHRIEVPIVHWSGRRFVRPSFHLYNDEADLERFVSAIGELAEEGGFAPPTMLDVGTPGVVVRAERPDDVAAIRRVHLAAFPESYEADLVDRLRDTGDLLVSLVAETAGEVVGHVAFSPVSVDGERTDPPAVGLAPLAVLPDRQRSGIGRSLVEAGLEVCRESRAPFAVVLGDAEYYSRFGFTRADELAFGNAYGAGAEFRILELADGGFDRPPGLVGYAPAFDALP